ncbi:hypothetical protein K490DRAFT_65547 [Saccharata proteae CBS 121410]|uniref:F-box domain-containing protein n=1 Tax=Saccharata proteae CBS 121410 TaxID=1314787 RepID=A0A9P4LVP2_9PEZI|nr:hypothetical protein K490DRAFT_65547 [Saccharata proteae CBS 121410]
MAPSIFFRLPPELRLEVYEYCFDIEYDESINSRWDYNEEPLGLQDRTWKHTPRGLQLCLVCRLIFKECSYLFYRMYFPHFRFIVNTLEMLKKRLLSFPEYYRHVANATFTRPEIPPFTSGSPHASQQVLIWPPSGASWARYVESDGYTRYRLYCNGFMISKHLSPTWQLLLWRIDGKAGNIPWKEGCDAQIDCDKLLVYDMHYKIKFDRATQSGSFNGIPSACRHSFDSSFDSSTRAPSPVDDDSSDGPPPESAISSRITTLAVGKLDAVKEVNDKRATQDVPPDTRNDSDSQEDQTYLSNHEVIQEEAPGGVEPVSLQLPRDQEGLRTPSNSTARKKRPASDGSEEQRPKQHQKMEQSDRPDEGIDLLEAQIDQLLKEQAVALDVSLDSLRQESSAIITINEEEAQEHLAEPIWSCPKPIASTPSLPRPHSPYPLPPAITADSPPTDDNTYEVSTPHISPDKSTLPSQTPRSYKNAPPAPPTTPSNLGANTEISKTALSHAPPAQPTTPPDPPHTTANNEQSESSPPPSAPLEIVPGDTTPLKKPAQPAEARPWWDTPPSKRGGTAGGGGGGGGGGGSRSPRKRVAYVAEAPLSHTACMLQTSRGSEEVAEEFCYQTSGDEDVDAPGAWPGDGDVF